MERKKAAVASGKDGISECVIGKGSRLEGTFTCAGLLRIEGESVGKLIVSGTLVVTEGARVEADAEAEDIIVASSFKGSLKARNSVRLAPTAKVRANVTSRSFKLEDGGLFQGSVSGIAE